MKTPREILLEQHRAAAPKLDAIRREVVTELNRQDAKAQKLIMRKLRRQPQSVAQASPPVSSGIVPMPETKRGGTPLKPAAVTAALRYSRTAVVAPNIGAFVVWLLGGPNKLWRELIFPCRRTWTALAAVWVLIFIFNVSQRDNAELAARKLPPPSPEAVMAWRQQERLLAELIGPSAPGDAEQRKIFLPKPRTENAEFLTA